MQQDSALLNTKLQKNQKFYQKCVPIDKCTCLMRMAQNVVYA